MKLIKSILTIAIFGLSLCSLKAQQNQVIDEVIAVVGNTPILRSELDILISQLDPELEVTKEIRCQLLQKLLIDKMLVHQAEIDSLPLSDDEINDRIDNNIRFFERQMNSRLNVEKYLGMTVAEYKSQIFPKVKSQMLLERMEQRIKSEIKITPKEVRDYYNKLPVDSLPFMSSEVEVAQLVLNPSNSKEAKDIALEQALADQAAIIARDVAAHSDRDLITKGVTVKHNTNNSLTRFAHASQMRNFT